jgi:hypothetical protein
MLATPQRSLGEKSIFSIEMVVYAPRQAVVNAEVAAIAGA